jgi:predicted amidohydrolase
MTFQKREDTTQGKLKIGVTEIDIGFEDKNYARSNCLRVMEEAHREGVDILVFPEMTLTGFTMNPQRVAEPLAFSETQKQSDEIADEEKYTLNFFMECSKKYDMAMIFGMATQIRNDEIQPDFSIMDENHARAEISVEDETHYENKLIMVDGKQILMDYSKIHPFSYSGEDKVYKAGDRLSGCEYAGIGMSGYICYDLRFPEIFTAAADDCQVFFVIANWPETRVSQWELLLSARAVENQLYVVGVNRTGVTENEKYVASSHVYDYLGHDISRRVSDQLLVAEISRDVVDEARKKFPQRRDRKPQLYASMLEGK